MSINSNRKGKKYEQKIARAFRNHYPKAKRGNQDNMVNTEADVEGTPFRIECKDYAKIGVFRFWDQAMAEQVVHGDRDRPVLLVFKEKGSPDLAALDLDLFLAMVEHIKAHGGTITRLQRLATARKLARLQVQRKKRLDKKRGGSDG